MHLAMATTNWTSAMPALPWAMSGMMPWKPDLAAEGRALAPLLNEAGVTAIGAAVAEEADTRLRELISGIYAYWHHPYRRRTRSRPVAWSEGSSRLDDYGRPAKGGDSRGTDAGLPALLVPSLVNRGYILDLMPERSFAGYLAKRGIRPLLLEWGAPGEAEAHFDLTAYIARLERALAHVAERSGRPVALVGYCMGGLLALAVALRRPDLVSGLGLLATPWDFHAEHLWIPPFLAASTPIFESTLQTLGHFPVDALQAGFAMLNPTLVPEKFRRFAAPRPRQSRGADLRRRRGLAERRRAAGGRRRSRLHHGLVPGQRAEAGAMAGSRPAGRTTGSQPSKPGGHPGAGSDRAAGLGHGTGRRAAPHDPHHTAARPYRHGRVGGDRHRSRAAAHRLAAVARKPARAVAGCSVRWYFPRTPTFATAHFDPTFESKCRARRGRRIADRRFPRT